MEIIAVVIGLVTKAAVARMKKYKIDPLYGLWALCIVMGAVYASFKTFFPLSFQEGVLSFIALVGFAAMNVHEIAKRRGRPPVSPKTDQHNGE